MEICRPRRKSELMLLESVVVVKPSVNWPRESARTKS